MEDKQRKEAKRNLDYSYLWAANPSLWGVYDHRELFPEDFQEERVDSEIHQVEDGQDEDEEASEQSHPGAGQEDVEEGLGQFARERINVLKSCLARIKARRELGPEPLDGPDVTTIRCDVDNFFSRKSNSRIINAC